MRNLKKLALLPALTIISGCVGVGSATEGEILARSFAEEVENNGAFGATGTSALAQINSMSGLGVTSESNLPTGEASYSGHMGVGTAENGVIGDMDVLVNFGGDGSFGGTVTNFVDETGAAVSGSLVIGDEYSSIDGSVDPEEFWQIQADVSGSVELGNEDDSFDADLNGEFLGSDGQHATGEISMWTFQSGTTTVGYFGVSR